MHRVDAGIPPVSSTAATCFAGAANVAAGFASAEEAAGCATVESQRGRGGERFRPMAEGRISLESLKQFNLFDWVIVPKKVTHTSRAQCS